MEKYNSKLTFDFDQIDEYRREHNTSVLAIMFTDVEGFTAYTNREGDVAAAKMLEVHDKVLLQAIKDNDGIPIKKIGDSFLAIFADP
jgi:class 3 adenylate cyclase